MRSSDRNTHTFCRGVYSPVFLAAIVATWVTGCAEKAVPIAEESGVGKTAETADTPINNTSPEEVTPDSTAEPEAAINESAAGDKGSAPESLTANKDETSESAESVESTSGETSAEEDAVAKFRAALNALDNSINSAKASHEVGKAKALGLVKEDSAKALEQIQSDADKGDVPVELVLLITTLIEKGRGGESLNQALGRYTKTEAPQEKEKVIWEICSIACRSEGQVLVGLGVLDAEASSTRGLIKMFDDVATGMVGVEAPLDAIRLIRSGNAGARFNQALASYAEANTDEERKQAIGKVLDAARQEE